MISTTTDDGTPIRCEVCGALSLVNVTRPPGDSVCPGCGSFLWVDALVEVTRERSFMPDIGMPQLVAKVRFDAICEITAFVGSKLNWTKNQLYELNHAILAREELGSTGIGNGFAVPHASVDWITSCTTVMAFSPNAIEFDSLDRQPVHTVILIASPKSNPREHLRLLETVSRSLRFRDQSTASRPDEFG